MQTLKFGDYVHVTGFSPSGQFLFVGAKKVTAIYELASGQKIKILQAANYDNGWNVKIMPRWVGNRFIGRWDKSARVWKLADEMPL